MKKLIFILIGIFIAFIIILKFTKISEQNIDLTVTQSNDSLYYLNPDYHIAKELINKKIVMLGEVGHYQPGNYRYLLNSLENWLLLCSEQDPSINLTLILELDENNAEEINKYYFLGVSK